MTQSGSLTAPAAHIDGEDVHDTELAIQTTGLTKRLIPVSLYWLLLIAALRVGQDQGWTSSVVVAVGIGAGALAWGLLSVAMQVGAGNAA